MARCAIALAMLVTWGAGRSSTDLPVHATRDNSNKLAARLLAMRWRLRGGEGQDLYALLGVSRHCTQQEVRDTHNVDEMGNED